MRLPIFRYAAMLFSGLMLSGTALAFGEIVASGDFNGDSVADFAIGVPGAALAPGTASHGYAGAVHVVVSRKPAGKSVVTLVPDAGAVQRAKASFGTTLQAADFNGDGRQDLAVGDPQARLTNEARPGVAWIFLATASGFEKGIPVGPSQRAQNAAGLELSLIADGIFAAPPAPQAPLGEMRLFRAGCSPLPAFPWDEMTPLQKHVAFFDVNGDGRISVGEDFQGLQDVGIPPALAAPMAAAINLVLGTPTSGFPSLSIRVDNIEAASHGSTSGLYDDNELKLDVEKFNVWFERWDKDDSGGLSPRELATRSFEESDLLDPIGASAAAGEYALLFAIAAENGELSRETLMHMFDGSLFYRLAEKRGTLRCRAVPYEERE